MSGIQNTPTLAQQSESPHNDYWIFNAFTSIDDIFFNSLYAVQLCYPQSSSPC
jgi:hypothetical protein